jgi:hypothetical protein
VFGNQTKTHLCGGRNGSVGEAAGGKCIFFDWVFFGVFFGKVHSEIVLPSSPVGSSCVMRFERRPRGFCIRCPMDERQSASTQVPVLLGVIRSGLP